MSYRNNHSFSQQQKNNSKSHSFTPLQQPTFHPHDDADPIGISPLPIPQDYDRVKVKDIELEELGMDSSAANTPRKQQTKKRGKTAPSGASESDDSSAAAEQKKRRIARRKTAQSIFDAIVTSSLNVISFMLFVAALATPSVLLFVLGFNFYYFLIFGALLIPCLISLVTTYYSCIVWIRGAKTCRLCLIVNGFLAFGFVCAAISFMLAIGGTYSLIEYVPKKL